MNVREVIYYSLIPSLGPSLSRAIKHGKNGHDLCILHLLFICGLLKYSTSGTALVAHWLRPHTPSAGTMGLSPGWETKIMNATVWPKINKITSHLYFVLILGQWRWAMVMDSRWIQSLMEIYLSETRYYIAIKSSVELCNRMLFLSKLSQKEKRNKRKWLASWRTFWPCFCCFF